MKYKSDNNFRFIFVGQTVLFFLKFFFLFGTKLSDGTIFSKFQNFFREPQSDKWNNAKSSISIRKALRNKSLHSRPIGRCKYKLSYAT